LARVLTKPEHEAYADTLHKLIEEAPAENGRRRARQESQTALPLAAAK
jgi:hypothetical protein